MGALRARCVRRGLLARLGLWTFRRKTCQKKKSATQRPAKSWAFWRRVGHSSEESGAQTTFHGGEQRTHQYDGLLIVPIKLTVDNENACARPLIVLCRS